jgi:hypothetical protein
MGRRIGGEYFAISKEINEDITYNEELLKSREDAAVLHTTKKK